MTLFHRKYPHKSPLTHSMDSLAARGSKGDKNKTILERLAHCWMTLVAALVVVLLLLLVATANNSVGGIPLSLHKGGQSNLLDVLQRDPNIRILHVNDLIERVSITMALFQLGTSVDDPIATGEHVVQVTFLQDQHNQKEKCSSPRFSLRFVGPSLVYVQLVEQPSHDGVWLGNFSFSVLGDYRLEVGSYGCSSGHKDDHLIRTTESTILRVAGVVDRQNESLDARFPPSVWLRQTDYVWADPNRSQVTTLSTSDASVISESAATERNRFFQFQDLSNYELLCFVGNRTMQEIRREFMELRPKLFVGQRPFKFHLYNLAGFFVQPDRYWTKETKERMRKCKHMLVNLEEVEGLPLSQLDYQKQFVNFVGHLLNVMNDSTFPIQLLTWMQPPMFSHHCHTPFLPRTTDHPCNDVLKELFRNKMFSPRVKLLDNTDISLPLLEKGNSSLALANVALRIYVAVGHQVAQWRTDGQYGAVDGLHRNGTVEPNFELVPYEGWNQ